MARVALGRHLAQRVDHGAGAGADQAADDDVVLEAVERIDLGVEQALVSTRVVSWNTRYRKDQTGGLDEEQIREVQARVERLRLLQERKQTILRSIESQGKLTPELSATIEAADTTRRLEDLYLPFKPKKQTLATLARARGLEPLALEILAPIRPLRTSTLGPPTSSRPTRKSSPPS